MEFVFIIIWFVFGVINVFLSRTLLHLSAADACGFSRLTLSDQKKIHRSVFFANFYMIFAIVCWTVNFVAFFALYFLDSLESFFICCITSCFLELTAWSFATAESIRIEHLLGSWITGKRGFRECQASWRAMTGAGLACEKGVVLGQKSTASIIFNYNSHPLKNPRTVKAAPLVCYDNGYNTLAVGPVNSGKTAGIAIPSAMLWQDNIIVADPSGDIYRATSCYRRKSSKVYLLSPDSADSARYNPLDDIPENSHIEKFAISLAAPLFKLKNEEKFYDFLAARIFSATAVHIAFSELYNKECRNLVFTAQLIEQRGKELWRSLAEEMLSSAHKKSDGTPFEEADNFIKLCLADFPSLPKDIILDAAEHFHIAAKPLLSESAEKLLSESDFSAKDFFNPEKKLSVYIGSTKSFNSYQDKMCIISEYIQQFIAFFRTSDTAPAFRCLFVLDDFSIIPRISFLSESMSDLQLRKTSFIILAQSLFDIDNNYGPKEREHIIQESDITAFYQLAILADAQNALETIDSRAEKKLKNSFGAKDLFTLPPDSLLIVPRGMPHYLAKKVFFYDDPRFYFNQTNSEAQQNE